MPLLLEQRTFAEIYAYQASGIVEVFLQDVTVGVLGDPVAAVPGNADANGFIAR